MKKEKAYKKTNTPIKPTIASKLMSKNKKTVPEEMKNCSKNTKNATKINNTPKLKATLKFSENSSKVRFKTISNIT